MNYLPGRKRYWVIAPKADADFAAGLEIVLDAYARPPGPARPLVCLDETSKQWDIYAKVHQNMIGN